MLKFNTLVFSILAIFCAFITASTSAADDGKHCAPRACCGCPGNGKAKVKVLMDVFLTKYQDGDKDDAFKLISTDTVSVFQGGEVCAIVNYSIVDFYNIFFPINFILNADFDYKTEHSGDVVASFLSIVVDKDYNVFAYKMSYRWRSDEACNWHIVKIDAITATCFNFNGL